MIINIYTYGLKYKKAYLLDIDLDARILVNPYYDLNLRSLNGKDSDVANYILNDSKTSRYLFHLKSFLDFYLFNINKEIINVGIHCTGGYHRSVFVAEYLKKTYINLNIVVHHLELGDRYA